MMPNLDLEKKKTNWWLEKKIVEKWKLWRKYVIVKQSKIILEKILYLRVNIINYFLVQNLILLLKYEVDAKVPSVIF